VFGTTSYCILLNDIIFLNKIYILKTIFRSMVDIVNDLSHLQKELGKILKNKYRNDGCVLLLSPLGLLPEQPSSGSLAVPECG
jgi:hypothetical protein